MTQILFTSLYNNIYCTVQALESGEEGRSIDYATNKERKPLNRFGNIVVCEWSTTEYRLLACKHRVYM